MRDQQPPPDADAGKIRDPFDLPPPDYRDPVIEAYKRDVDRTLLRENLKLSVAERGRKFQRNMAILFELRRAGRKRRLEARE